MAGKQELDDAMAATPGGDTRALSPGPMGMGGRAFGDGPPPDPSVGGPVGGGSSLMALIRLLMSQGQPGQAQ